MLTQDPGRLRRAHDLLKRVLNDRQGTRADPIYSPDQHWLLVEIAYLLLDDRPGPWPFVQRLPEPAGPGAHTPMPADDFVPSA